MGYFLSLSKLATENWLDASELLLLICGLVLAYGAAGEYLEEHGKLPRWMKWSSHPNHVFVWMVAISLFGEFAGDAGVYIFSGHLQSINDTEVAQLDALTQPRNLEDPKALTDACRPFRGHVVQVLSYSTDGEAWRLAQQIIGALRDAQLNVLDSTANTVALGGFETGVVVQGPESEEPLKKAIVGVLGARNLIIRKPSLINVSPPPPVQIERGGPLVPAISVMVGVKPLPTQATRDANSNPMPQN